MEDRAIRAHPAESAALGKAGTVTAPEPEDPQPRDIALEQATPEQAIELEEQSDPAPATGDGS
jgi:hypothetical protein